MRYKEVRERIKTFSFGEHKYKEDVHELKLITQMAIEDIATRVIPAALVSSDMRRYAVLRYIDNGRFVRQPNPIVDDNSEIELDASLSTALLYRIAAQIATDSKKKYYEDLYRRELDNYVYARFYSTQKEYGNDSE